MLKRAALFLVVLLAGCSSQRASVERTQGAAAIAQPGLFAIGAPSTLKLPAPRGASFVPTDLYKEAEDFDVALPHQRVVADADGATFTPNWVEVESPGFSQLSFAMYDFHIAGFAGTPILQYGWRSAPAVPTNTYVGLANWDTDRWDWFRGNAAGKLSMPSLDPYVDFGGGLLACVMQAYPDSNELDWVRIGSTPPIADLTTTVVSGLIPLDVAFDASASTDSDGTIAEYRWDPEGDGSFDETSGTDPHYSTQYAVAADRHPAVRVIDDDGVYADKSVHVNAYASADFTYGSQDYLTEVCERALPTADGKLLLFSNLITPFTTWASLTQLSPLGEVDYTRRWGIENQNQTLTDATLSADGEFAYCCGAGNVSGFVQKWSPEGELLWCREFHVTDHPIYLKAVTYYDDSHIFVAGQAWDSSYSNSNSLLARMNSDGEVLWCRSITTPDGRNEFRDVAASEGIQIGSFSVKCCGVYQNGTGEQALFAAYDEDGNLTSASRLVESGCLTYANSVLVTGKVTSPVTYVLVSRYESGDTSTICSKLGGAAIEVSQPFSDLGPMELISRGTGEMEAVCNGLNNVTLLKLSTDPGLISAELLDSTDGSPAAAGATLIPGKGFICNGLLNQSLPALQPAFPTSAAYGFAWQAISPPDAALSVTVIDGSTSTTDVGALDFNRQAGDDDAYIHIEQL